MHLSIFILLIINLSLTTSQVKKPRETSYCKITQEKYSDHFDFSALTNDTTDYRIVHEANDFLTLQLCKPLKKPCNGLNGYAVCYSRNGKEYAIGKEPPDVIVEFGETIFRYTGEQCDNKNNYTVNTKMICDFADKKSDDILLFPTAYDACNFNIEWRTNHACAERQQINCTVNHESETYDLSPLINYSDNYEVKINSTYSVVLNVCHSVLYRPNSCKSDNAACLVIKGEQSTNLGTLVDNLKYNETDKSLSMTYKDGAVCRVKGALANQLQTTITFICDQNAIGTRPKYIGGMEECHYKFKWITAAACSVQVLEKKRLEDQNRTVCSLKHRAANFVYNFTSLMNKEISVNPFGVPEELYEFNICGPVVNTTCTKGSGACRIRGNFSGGMANSNLLWKEKGPYLNYTNGSPCGIGNQKMYTIIEFYCSNIQDYEIDERPELCHDVIKMTTELACLVTPKPCVTVDKSIDLNPLILRSSSYLAKSEDSEFHINVCHPLIKEGGEYCPDDAAICKFTNKNGQLSNPTSLGLASNSPTLGTDGSVNLIYDGGASCEDDKEKKVGSNVSFVCDVTEGKGIPTYKGYKNCTYFFEWKTVLACGKVNSKLDKENCLISNHLGGVQSLSFVKEVMSPQFTVHKDKTYNVSLCGFTDCRGGFICTEKVVYGTNVNIVTDYSVNSIQINFTQGTLCRDGSRAKSSITLICDEINDQRIPKIIKEEPCNVEFEWRTSEVCHRPDEKANKVTPSSSISSNLSGGQIAGIIFAIFLILIAIVYSTRRWNLLELITNSTSRHCDHVRYSRVNTEEEVHLLLDASDPNVIETDSDDDLLQG